MAEIKTIQINSSSGYYATSKEYPNEGGGSSFYVGKKGSGYYACRSTIGFKFSKYSTFDSELKGKSIVVDSAYLSLYHSDENYNSGIVGNITTSSDVTSGNSIARIGTASKLNSNVYKMNFSEDAKACLADYMSSGNQFYIRINSSNTSRVHFQGYNKANCPFLYIEWHYSFSTGTITEEDSFQFKESNRLLTISASDESYRHRLVLGVKEDESFTSFLNEEGEENFYYDINENQNPYSFNFSDVFLVKKNYYKFPKDSSNLLAVARLQTYDKNPNEGGSLLGTYDIEINIKLKEDKQEY